MFVNDEDTIPSIPVKKLASKKYTDFYIKNYAQIGYVSNQGMLQLLFELRRGNVPDIVIFYAGVNDAVSSLQNKVIGVPLNEEKRRMEFEELSQLPGILKSYISRSALATIAAYVKQKTLQTNKTVTGYQQCPSELIEQTIQAYVFNARLLRMLSEEYNFEIFFFWQPTIFSMHNISNSELLLRKRYAKLEPFLNCVYLETASIAEQTPRFFDFQKITAPENKALFFDFCHTQPAANEIIAARIVDIVTARSTKLSGGVKQKSASDQTFLN
jgi:hypothetical protein